MVYHYKDITDENVTFDGTKPISDLRDTSVNGGFLKNTYS